MTILRQSSRRILKLLLILCVVCLLAPPAKAIRRNEMLWDAGVALYSDSGKYGTDTRTTTTYIPFSITRYFDQGDVEFIVPSISVNTQGQVVIINGVPNPTGRGRGNSTTTTTVTPVETESGIGDLLLRGRYYLVEERSFIPMMDVLGEVKFPTASHSKGLGTGKFDEGGSLEFTKTFTKRWLGLADVGYMVIGSPSDEPLNNQWHFSFGPAYYLKPTSLLMSLNFEESESIASDEANPIDLLWSIVWRVTRRVRVRGALLIGLSTGAPAIGFEFGGNVRF